MGRYLDIVRGLSSDQKTKKSLDLDPRDNAGKRREKNTVHRTQDSNAKEANLAKKGSDLETRLVAHGISIAIDRATGSALLLFKPSDAEVVRDVADVYQPFHVALTPAQRNEMSDSLEYYERLERRA